MTLFLGTMKVAAAVVLMIFASTAYAVGAGYGQQQVRSSGGYGQQQVQSSGGYGQQQVTASPGYFTTTR